MSFIAVYLASLESWNDRDCHGFLRRFVFGVRTLANFLTLPQLHIISINDFCDASAISSSKLDT